MRETLRDPGRLEHILTCIDNVQDFVAGNSYDDMSDNKMLFYAVVKNNEIIGEAANSITKELRQRHSEVEWAVIIGMRHVLVHDYYNIDSKTAWRTATKDLPALRPQIAAILKELNNTNIQ